MSGCSLITKLDDLGGADGGDDSSSAVGTEGHACYANGTCNAGLACVSNVCVFLDDAGSDASADALDEAVSDAPFEVCPSFGPFTSDAGPYCPFQKDGSTSFSGDCPNNDHCCEYSASSGLPSTCSSLLATCTNDAGALDYRCDETNDCPQGNKCCLNGSVMAVTDGGCVSYVAANVTGTSCAATCPVQVCGTQADCFGLKCVPFTSRSVILGFCQ